MAIIKRAPPKRAAEYEECKDVGRELKQQLEAILYRMDANRRQKDHAYRGTQPQPKTDRKAFFNVYPKTVKAAVVGLLDHWVDHHEVLAPKQALTNAAQQDPLISDPEGWADFAKNCRYMDFREILRSSEVSEHVVMQSLKKADNKEEIREQFRIMRDAANNYEVRLGAKLKHIGHAISNRVTDIERRHAQDENSLLQVQVNLHEATIASLTERVATLEAANKTNTATLINTGATTLEDQVLALRKQGVSQRNIADQLGTNQSKVKRILQKAGV